MSDLTLGAIKLIAQTLDDTPGLQATGAKAAITQLLRQLDAANATIAADHLERVKAMQMLDQLEAGVLIFRDAANAMVGAALREAADPELLSRGLRSGAHDVVIDAVRNNILALAPDATAALDRALERMRERCVISARNTVCEIDWPPEDGDLLITQIVDALRALPLHEDPNNDAG